MPIAMFTKWVHNHPKDYPSVDEYTLSGKPISYQIIKVDNGDDDSEKLRWIIVKKQPKSNKAGTAVVPTSNVYTDTGWKRYPWYRDNAKTFNTPKEAYEALMKLESKPAKAAFSLATIASITGGKVVTSTDAAKQKLIGVLSQPSKLNTNQELVALALFEHQGSWFGTRIANTQVNLRSKTPEFIRSKTSGLAPRFEITNTSPYRVDRRAIDDLLYTNIHGWKTLSGCKAAITKLVDERIGKKVEFIDLPVLSKYETK